MICLTETSCMQRKWYPKSWMCFRSNHSTCWSSTQVRWHWSWQRGSDWQQRISNHLALSIVKAIGLPPIHLTGQYLKTSLFFTLNQNQTVCKKYRSTSNWQRKTTTGSRKTGVRKRWHSMATNNTGKPYWKRSRLFQISRTAISDEYRQLGTESSLHLRVRPLCTADCIKQARSPGNLLQRKSVRCLSRTSSDRKRQNG